MPRTDVIQMVSSFPPDKAELWPAIGRSPPLRGLSNQRPTACARSRCRNLPHFLVSRLASSGDRQRLRPSLRSALAHKNTVFAVLTACQHAADHVSINGHDREGSRNVGHTYGDAVL